MAGRPRNRSRDRGGAGPRANQKLRTRKDLLMAAAQLMKDGYTPTMDEVAEAALVSRATAYRYFPTLEALLVEAPLQGETPAPEGLFADDASVDPVERIGKALAALHRMTYRNAPQLRLMLANSLSTRPDGTPRRQNRRSQLIEAALEPVRDQLDAANYRRLCRALALVFGTEAMVVCTDVLQLNERAAREVTGWAAEVLVRAALAPPDDPRLQGS